MTIEDYTKMLANGGSGCHKEIQFVEIVALALCELDTREPKWAERGMALIMAIPARYRFRVTDVMYRNPDQVYLALQRERSRTINPSMWHPKLEAIAEYTGWL